MTGTQVNVAVQAPKPQDNPLSSLASNNMIPQISSEGYKLIDRLVDPNALYLDKLTTFLYSAHLVKSNTISEDDFIPGYRLVKVGGVKWKPNVNLIGTQTITSEVLMALAEDGSVTRFPADFLLERFAARQTMAIIGMMISNREEWEFTNYTMIYPFGLTLWKAIVAVLSRSRADAGHRTLLDLLVHPNLWFTQGGQNTETPNKKWFNI